MTNINHSHTASKSAHNFKQLLEFENSKDFVNKITVSGNAQEANRLVEELTVQKRK
jgi:hypothetical protein